MPGRRNYHEENQEPLRIGVLEAAFALCLSCCFMSLCFMQSGKELVLGGIKPPKAKEWDEEKTYMQRPVGEQFRPPPPKGPQTKQGAGRQ